MLQVLRFVAVKCAIYLGNNFAGLAFLISEETSEDSIVFVEILLVRLWGNTADCT
jgi:hypothetical protein